MVSLSPVRRAQVRARQAPLRVLAAVAAATAADVALDPEHRHLPLCPFHAMTGWQCPLCGGLRAVDALVHGRVADALHDNVLVVAAIPLVAALWLTWLIRPPTARTSTTIPRAATVALIVLAVCFTVVRNLPFAAALRPR
jgi:hypothetical protein